MKVKLGKEYLLVFDRADLKAVIGSRKTKIAYQDDDEQLPFRTFCNYFCSTEGIISGMDEQIAHLEELPQ